MQTLRQPRRLGYHGTGSNQQHLPISKYGLTYHGYFSETVHLFRHYQRMGRGPRPGIGGDGRGQNTPVSVAVPFTQLPDRLLGKLALPAD
jgi:hypothetical protein